MTVQVFVDTNDGVGDGSGRDADAYEDLATAESNISATSFSEPWHIICAGSTVDDTAVLIDGTGANSTHNLFILGDRSATDDDGFVDDKITYSTSHYRLEQITTGAVARPLILVDRDITVDGIQIGIDTDTQFSWCIWLPNQIDRIKIFRTHCYDFNASSPVTNTFGIFTEGSQNDVTFDSNLIVGFNKGIEVNFQAFGGGDLFIYNNTVVEASGTGIEINNTDTGSFHTASVINNVCHSNGGSDYTASWSSGTVTVEDNFFEDGLGTTREVDISAAAASVFVSPGTGTTSDWSPKASGPLDPGQNAGVQIGETTDIVDATRSTPYTGGAYHFVAAGGGTEQTVLTASGSSTVSWDARYTVKADLSSSGLGSLSASSRYTIKSTLSASGTSETLWSVENIKTTDLTASGSSTVSWDGQAKFRAQATLSGTSSISWEGRWTAKSTFSSTGNGELLASSDFTHRIQTVLSAFGTGLALFISTAERDFVPYIAIKRRRR